MSLFKTLFFLLLGCLSISCNYKEREAALQQKEEMLTQKEHKLLIWEKDLQLKEDSIKILIARRDSSSFADSISVLPPELHGDWTAKMICIETNCPGSAIGDVQTDTWQVTTQDSSLIIKSIARDGQINRVYTGSYFLGNTIKASVSTENPARGGKRVIELTDIRNNKMKGTRTVIQAGGCRILYSVDMDKKQ